MQAAAQYVLDQMVKMNQDIVLPAEYLRPGGGTTHSIREFFSEFVDIIELRSPFLLEEDFRDLPYVDVNNEIKYAENKLAASLVNDGILPKLVIIDEHHALHPKVREMLDGFLKQNQIHGTHIFFIWR